jgi:hypothetical protein
MPGKRKKDPEYHELREILEQLLDATERYRRRLEDEQVAARAEPQPYEHLIRALDAQIATTRELETQLDGGIWPLVIRLGNGSAHVEHTRTRGYF